MSPLVTILLPNYKTLVLTKLCLELLQRNTPRGLYKLIVIDNDSQDASTEYLRNLTDIMLIERRPEKKETVGQSHCRALDLALRFVDTEYVLSIHTDTFVHHPKWLEYLLNIISQDKNIAGVGSWKLEYKSLFQRFFKLVERFFIPPTPENTEHYLRSHCALYRTSLLKKHKLSFGMGNSVSAGKRMHQELVARKYDMIFLSPEELGKYVDHVNHATMILNPDLGADKRTIRKGQKRIARYLRLISNKILN